MKRALLIILGFLLLLIGLGTAAVGTVMIVAVGSDGTYSADAGRVAGTGNALLLNEFTVDTGGYTDTVQKFATLTAGANATNGQQVFIGSGPSAAVDNYLAGVPRDVVSEIGGSSSKVITIPGTAEPAAPDEQSFWTAKAVGTSPTITVEPRPGTTLVIMNADSSAPVAVNLSVGIKSAAVFPAGIVLAVVGLLFVLLAIWSFLAARRARRNATARQPQPYVPPEPLPYFAPPTAPTPQPQPQPQPQPPPTMNVPPPTQSTAPTPPRPSAGGDGPPEPLT